MPLEVQYGIAHDVFIEPGGVLERLLGAGRSRSTRCTARASIASRRACASRRARPTAWSRRSRSPMRPASRSALQWHPEWQAADNPVSMRLLGAFGDARARATAQRARTRTP